MPSLEGILLLFRSTGIGQILRILRYTLQRERLDRRYRRMKNRYQNALPVLPGRLLSTEGTPNGVKLHFEKAGLLIEFLTSDLASITWEPGKPPVPYAIAKNDWGRVQTSLDEDAERIQVSSESLHIRIDSVGSLQFSNAKGGLIHQENPPLLRGEASDASWSSHAPLQPEEVIYGLGEQAGPLNLRGTSHRMWNTDPGGSYGPTKDPIYMPVPIYMGLHKGGCYLLFFENSFPATFSFGLNKQSSVDSTEVVFEGGMLRYYFSSGNPAQLLQRYTQLTGRPGLPPLWSLGYHQSRWGYQNEADIHQVVQGFREHNMPLSAIHLDIDYMRGYRVFTVDQDRFPDLAALSSELDKQGIKLVTIINPGVKRDPNNHIYQGGKAGNHFCRLPTRKTAFGVVWPGVSAYPDFTDSNTRLWWSEHYKPLIEAGVSGFWHDMNEPTSFAAWGELSPPLGMQHALDGQSGDHYQAHNLYALLMNRTGFKALQSHHPERRPWILSRSGWASQQRFAWNWTGDTESSWDSLRMTIATVLGQGLSGLPYTGPDIGGFSGSPSAELYLRWFQLATFMPFFRTHSAIGTPSREPWVYGEPYTSIIRKYMQLRMRLLPYLYTLAWQTSQTGLPLVRPLFWVTLEDQNLWEVDDAFFLGDALLIAPILDQGQNKRLLYLPPGTWYDWWSDEAYKGPGKIELGASLDRIPILVRAGSILPMEENDRLTLHMFPPDTQMTSLPQVIYCDAGDGYGASRLDRFTVTKDGRDYIIEWQDSGDFPFPYSQVELFLHGMQASMSWIDEKPTPLEENRILTGQFRRIHIEAIQ